jgi:serine/threonine protein kinase
MMEKLCMNCFEEFGDKKICPHCGYDNSQSQENLLYLNRGTVLNGKFMVGKGLGHGGFGITYLGYDLNLHIKVAIKEYMPQTLVTRQHNHTKLQLLSANKQQTYQTGVDKFLDEAKTVAKFNNNPNIVTVRDYFNENNTAYIVMDYMEGCDLKAYVVKNKRPLSFNQARNLLNPILDALVEIHSSGILHRDISPDNIFITKKGTPILLDFGAARQYVDQQNGLSVILKPGYAPEEQYRRDGNSGPWTDIYAFGATFYHVITGKRPIDSLDRLENDGLNPPSSLGVALSSNAQNALLKALAVKGKDRFQRVADFKQALNNDADSKIAVGTAKKSGNKTAKSPAAFKGSGKPYVKHDAQNVRRRKKNKSTGLIVALALVSVVIIAIIIGVVSYLLSPSDVPVIEADYEIVENQSEQEASIEPNVDEQIDAPVFVGEPIKIGVMSPTTGDGAANGMPIKQGPCCQRCKSTKAVGLMEVKLKSYTLILKVTVKRVPKDM